MTQPNPNVPDDDNGAGDTKPPTTPNPNDFETARLNSEAKKYRLQAKALGEELEKLKHATASETEQAIAKARSEGEQVYQSRWREALVANAAMGRLTSKGVTATELAVKALDLSDVDVDLNSGRVDAAALDGRIDELLQRFPMLAGTATGEPAKPPPGQIGANGQRRVTQEELISADKDKRNDLLRSILRGE